ncbi:prepilin peptidase [Streptomyces marincola]|uniref:prepilin peptidase n=1 Tax=Streptomyces marincola TaxID=2878388 RepID=UPI002100426D|nr:A24 family peptidase [Streptomyces marincola]
MSDLPIVPVAATVYGALAGLLLARPAYRLSVAPGRPWRAPCPARHPRPAGRLAPLTGWLGPARCARCAAAGRRFGARPVLPAAVTAACCAVLATSVGERPELAVWLLAAPAVVLLAMVDFAVQRLPDVLTLPLAGVVVAGLALAAPSDAAGGVLGRALLAGAVLSGVYFLLFLINPRGMGFGDVKLAMPVGVALGWYGWGIVFFGTFVGFLLVAGYGLSLVIARRADRKSTVPFGPFMALGALVGIVLGGLAA